MSKMPKKLIAFFIIIACVVAIYGIRFYAKSSSTDTSKDVPTKVKGDVSAPIQITEFVDFQCHSCAHGSKDLKKLMEEHPGRIRVEVKYFPLKMHKHGVLSARYAECASRQEKFWPFHDNLFEQQKNWMKLIDAKSAFEFIAKDTGLDLKELAVCLEDETIDDVIQKNKKEGEALGVKSTPTYFINGKMVVGAKLLKVELNKLIGEVKN